MNKRLFLSLALVASLLLVGSTAMAGWGYGPGNGRGYGPGCGGGNCYGGAGGYGAAYDEDTAKLFDQLRQKQFEMQGLMSAPEVDEGKVKSLQTDIDKLRNELSQKRLSAQLEFRKRNPDWRPGYGSGGGRGGNWGRGGCRRW